MESSVKQRLINFLDYKRISKAEFSRKLGVSSSYIGAMRKSIQPDKVERIAILFPDLNIQWLLTGSGEMINTTSNIISNANGVVISGSNNMPNSSIDNRHYYSDSPDVLRAQIELLDERIKEKDAQIKEKDAQIKEKDAQIKSLLDILSKNH